MDTFLHAGAVISGIAVILFVAAVLILAIYAVLAHRAEQAKTTTSEGEKNRPETKTTGSAVEKTKKALVSPPAWALSSLTILGGWVCLMFAVWIFWPSAWLWLSSHPAFIWAAPLCLAVSGILYASKKTGAQMLAYLIVAVLVIALGNSFSWTTSTERARDTSASSVSHGSAQYPGYWDNCVKIPQNTAVGIKTKVRAPVGVESSCYQIRGGYRFRYELAGPVRMRWQNGTVYDDRPGRYTDLGDNFQHAAVKVMSLSRSPTTVTFWFQKK
ncbi:MAG: hypothetical protein A3D67_00170 [Candidatus Lloydbacteria bacterium RIFCSPHIGHO2_02_FULL_51_22]|uniref:Uncharacterized protein n=1 Tax=Candidatus Lloydbacteria bacterium RIFCSPHIGHO2_02_FULL_51_22 TaxID=1798663 RepID=A0A1G2DDA4_9BACT|nr:MAG: hypothetical protein A3D67_00170 [Candidatus Lloydbacteria bacterium RIFCSPHIGHO2_02_FULL_51_22]